VLNKKTQEFRTSSMVHPKVKFISTRSQEALLIQILMESAELNLNLMELSLPLVWIQMKVYLEQRLDQSTISAFKEVI